MPRDGSGIYSQPFPAVVEGTTIESAVYNGYTADVSIDLNSPRPILAGGTGAASADEALDNLKAEKFKQIVTSWDTTIWRAGSFSAATTAIGIAPVTGHAFAGVVYYANATDLVIEATDLTDPASPDQYIRIMTAGVWGSWVRLNPNVSSANLGEYNFNNQVTFPPGAGQIRFNSATQNSTTEVFISHLSATGVDNSSQITAYLLSGVDFIVQDKDEGNKYKVFTTTAAAVLSGADYRVTATLKIAGIDLVTAQRMVVTASSEAQRVQQRQLIYAAPFDALAYNGMQINGSMEVSQELGAGATGNFSGALKYIRDGWNAQTAGTQAISGNSANVGPPGFSWCIQITVGTANASPAATDVVIFNQRIEGYRVARLAWGTANAQSITLGFWVYAVRPGNYSGAISNAANDRTYAFPFTVNTTNTWEYKTTTIPGCVDGTWAKDNTIGMNVYITMMAGSSRQITANTWANSVAFGVTGTINGVTATTDYMMLTGVVVLPGIEAPSAARSALIMRPYDQELLTCMRYFEKLNISITGSAAAGNNHITWFYKTIKRAAPTIAYAPGSAITPYSAGIEGINGYSTGVSPIITLGTTADARL